MTSLSLFMNDPLFVAFFRITIAVMLGAFVGAERSRVGKRAGLRTHALVAMGSALFIVIGEMINALHPGVSGADPMRMASQIIVGIGFLGAGEIFVQRSVLMGLTTAAGLWVAAGIGMAAGFGLYALATFVAIMTLVVFEVLWYVEEQVVRTGRSERALED